MRSVYHICAKCGKASNKAYDPDEKYTWAFSLGDRILAGAWITITLIAVAFAGCVLARALLGD